MAWYDDGTIAVTGGSAAVVGTGTSFVENVKIGDALRGPDERLYQIASVNSATSLTLMRNYAGATAAGQSYEIMPLQDAMAALARNVAALIEDYQDIADNAGQGMFGDGTVGTPGIRFANDQDTGMWRPSANVIAWALGGIERLRLDTTGLGIGTTPAAKLDVLTSGGRVQVHQAVNFTGTRVLSVNSGNTAAAPMEVSGAGVHITNSANSIVASFLENGNAGFGTASPSTKLAVGVNTGTSGLENSFSITNFVDSNVFIRISGTGDPDKRVQIGPSTGTALSFATSDNERMRLSGNNLLVGTSSGSWHVLKKAVPEGTTIFTFESAAGVCAYFNAVDGTGTSAASAGISIRAHSTTGRSINGGGTGNFSGSDYAEYMVKAAGCGTIAKGDVCGVDASGELTQSWAAASSFVIKSTNPSLVGGDTWANSLDPRPVPPEPLGPEPVAPIAPEPFTDPEPMQSEEESDAAFAVRLYIWGQASDAANAAQEAYDAAVAAFPDQLVAWESASATYAADLAQYEADLAAWEAALEAERVKVDRIAFCGQVPANLTGAFEVGDYVLPAEGDGDTITAIAVAESAITFDQYRRRLGKVWAIREGRAWIDVQHG